MKNMSLNFKRIKKIISSALIITFLLNIFSPIITYAAPPSLDSILITPNTSPIAQVQEVIVPRDLVSGDIISLTISGTTISQNFDTTSDLTLQLFNLKIDALTEVSSVLDLGTKKYTITATPAGIPFLIGNLIITRSPITPTTTVNNVVAVAQESEVTIPQNLFTGDVINFTVGGVALSQNFDTDKDTTLSSLANKITNNTNATGSWNSGTNKINMIAKTAGVGFNMSNFIVTSNGININSIQPNVIPVAQVNTFTVPRILYADEIIHVTIDGTKINQSYNTDTANTLSLFNQKKII